MHSSTRATLLQRLRDGADDSAWHEFFQRYWPLIYACARQRGCSDDTAEEIVQEVMLEVFRHRDLYHYDPARGRFRNWLAGIVRNKLAEYRRRPSQRVRARGGDGDADPVEPEAPPETAWETVFEEALLLILLDVVRRETPPRLYLAFELYALHDLAAGKVAKHTGLTRNHVYRIHRKVLRRLRELGAAYRRDGQLGERLKRASRLRPQPSTQQSLTAAIERTMRGRDGLSKGE